MPLGGQILLFSQSATLAARLLANAWLTPDPFGSILKCMLQYRSEPLNLAFQALSDPGRRAMIEHLSSGPASVSELAKPLPMTLSAVVQHLKILEEAGLVKSDKVGRVRTCRLDIRTMSQVERWIAERKRFWEQQYDRLEIYLAKTSPNEEESQ
ncbi:helix-turn-helix transcriptional regulator [Sphingosinicella sp. CPCC 101087]|uniref:ArsR/SmtB family transcription factor n=1 Tax=Sphingosinicella sp. CPCC 101087 TaxID=2497754 RepID=UPI001FB09E4D|nr:metalloregulator ArsR/SmtB family transcription factor [Sphingosinicella sp. CPCC 101087]